MPDYNSSDYDQVYSRIAGQYQGWPRWQALADFYEAKGGNLGNLPGMSFQFDERAAEQKALGELAPYYEQLLKMYGGDVALAKQRIDQDYERGLRTKTTATDWSKQDIDIATQERKRKLGIALGDVDQAMNQRGIYTSGIRTQERENVLATDRYSDVQSQRQAQELDRGLQQYKEEADVEQRRKMEELGYAKPVETPTTGQYAPSQTGLTPPGAAFTASNYVSDPVKKQLELEQQKKQDVATKVANQRTKAYEQWMTDATRLATMNEYGA